MSWTQQALDEFARRMGLEAWSPNQHGVAQLEFAGGAVLAVEPVADEVLVYLAQEVPWPTSAMWLDALRRCHVRTRGLWPVQAGCRATPSGTELVVLTRMPERSLTSQRLEEAVQSLLRWRDAWAPGGPQH